MKKLATALLLLMSACTSKTKFGSCVGIDDTEDAKYVYQYSKKNIVLGIVFFEMVLPPLFVVLDELKCPVEVR